MSDKLTPDELSHYRTFSIWHSADIGHKLLAHIAAVEAERDEAAALLREVAETLPPNYEPGELTPYCVWCGGNMWLKHAEDCIIERIRAWLAKVEREQTNL
jgi:hypothetical protein